MLFRYLVPLALLPQDGGSARVDESWDDEAPGGEEEGFSVDLPSEIRNADDAKRTLTAIRAAANRLGELSSDHENVQKAVNDLMKSVHLLQTQQFERPTETMGAQEGELGKRYLNPDGTLRWLGSERSIEFGGAKASCYEPGLLDDQENTCAWQLDLKKKLTQRNLARMCQKTPSTPRMDGEILLHLSRAPAANGFRKGLEEHTKRTFEGGRQRAFSNSSGAGSEWIPEQFIPDLYEAMQVRGEIRGQFAEIPLTSDSFRRPRVANVTRPYILSQITSDNPASFTASTPNTGDESYTVPGMAVRTLADVSATEDSAIAASAKLARQLIDSLADGVRDTTINGDTTSTHQDSISAWNLRSRWGGTGLGGSADHRRAWKGLRRQSVDRSNTLDMGALQTAAGILQLLALMGERAASNLRIFTSPEVVIQKLMGLTEVLTMDKFGQRATIVSGQIADLFNIPIIPTRFMGADLASTGLYTGSGAKSGLIIVDTSGYYFVNRRGEMVETQKIIQSQHLEIVATVRLGFDTPDDSSADNVVYGYNWL